MAGFGRPSPSSTGAAAGPLRRPISTRSPHRPSARLPCRRATGYTFTAAAKPPFISISNRVHNSRLSRIRQSSGRCQAAVNNGLPVSLNRSTCHRAGNRPSCWQSRSTTYYTHSNPAATPLHQLEHQPHRLQLHPGPPLLQTKPTMHQHSPTPMPLPRPARRKATHPSSKQVHLGTPHRQAYEQILGNQAGKPKPPHYSFSALPETRHLEYYETTCPIFKTLRHRDSARFGGEGHLSITPHLKSHTFSTPPHLTATTPPLNLPPRGGNLDATTRPLTFDKYSFT